jgi:hypothetical protein
MKMRRNCSARDTPLCSAARQHCLMHAETGIKVAELQKIFGKRELPRGDSDWDFRQSGWANLYYPHKVYFLIL